MHRSNDGFTLIETLVSITILTLIVLSVAHLIGEATTLTNFGIRRAEADRQARSLLDRMAVDFAQMLKRADVDYFLKAPANPQPGNDQLAFYSEVPGYYPSTGAQSPISLVCYRINAQNNTERLAKGLLWNGVSAGSSPIVFLPLTIATTWPAVTNGTADTDYEIAAANVFRLEYFYWLTNGTFSETPWDSTAGHTAIDGMRDVAAISVAIATIDSKSRVLLSDAQIRTMTGRMSDFTISMGPGNLLGQWQTTLDGTNDLPRTALCGIRIYQHSFDLTRKP